MAAGGGRGASRLGAGAFGRGEEGLQEGERRCCFRQEGQQDPGGMEAISRGLSTATSPEYPPIKAWYPGRDARGHGSFFPSAFCHPFRVRGFHSVVSGGIAQAQPPANGFDPSGIQSGFFHVKMG